MIRVNRKMSFLVVMRKFGRGTIQRGQQEQSKRRREERLILEDEVLTEIIATPSSLRSLRRDAIPGRCTDMQPSRPYARDFRMQEKGA